MVVVGQQFTIVATSSPKVPVVVQPSGYGNTQIIKQDGSSGTYVGTFSATFNPGSYTIYAGPASDPHQQYAVLTVVDCDHINVSPPIVASGGQITFTAVPTNSDFPAGSLIWKISPSTLHHTDTGDTCVVDNPMDYAGAVGATLTFAGGPRTVVATGFIVGIASISASATSITPGQSVTFTAIPTDNPSGKFPTDPQWVVTSGRVSSSKTGVGTTFTVTTSNAFTGTLIVQATEGAYSQAIASATVATLPPSISITPLTATNVNLGGVSLGSIGFEEYSKVGDDARKIVKEAEKINPHGSAKEVEDKLQNVQEDVDQLNKQAANIHFVTVAPVGPNLSKGTVKLHVDGTRGTVVNITTTNTVVTNSKAGVSGLGTLSTQQQTIPFDLAYTPNGNYGSTVISVASIDGRVVATQKVAFTGQTKQEATSIENNRDRAATKQISEIHDSNNEIFEDAIIVVGLILAIAAIFNPLAAIALATMTAAIGLAIKRVERVNEQIQTDGNEAESIQHEKNQNEIDKVLPD